MSDNQPLVVAEENEQVEVRKQKLAKLRDGGQTVYPNDFKPTHSLAAVIVAADSSSDEELHANPRQIVVAGRIMAIRRMGKASFFHIHDRRGRLQVYARKDKIGDDAYGLFQTFDIGDLVV
ncbi:MAG: OB-fold nucleic acid binding domain-containing protein, partial [Candidatus Binatia bacterium]